MEYVANLDGAKSAGQSADKTPVRSGCFLCDNAINTAGLCGQPGLAANPAHDPEAASRVMRDNLVLLHDARGLILLNKFPYCNGHLLVARPEHLANLSDYSPEQRAGLMELVALCERLLRQSYNAQGVNVGINIGRAAGAGVPGHLHIHVVPRWAGDVNFMEVVGNVRVIPQALDTSYGLLAKALAEMTDK
jgi:ATP adenylyltransferase